MRVRARLLLAAAAGAAAIVLCAVALAYPSNFRILTDWAGISAGIGLLALAIL